MSALIYKITSPDGSECYVGSTTAKYLCHRKAQHHTDYKRWKDGKKAKVSSCDLFERYGFANCLFSIVEQTTPEERLTRERYWIEAISTLGQNRPVISEEEKKELKHESYLRTRAERPEVLKERAKIYYEKVKEEQAKPIQCECGQIYTILHKKRHEATVKHRVAMGLIEAPVKVKRILTEEEIAEKKRRACEATKRYYAKDPEKARQRVREYAEKIGKEERAKRFKAWYDKNRRTTPLD